ncbi:DNA cytosine methyltransferase [Collinsella aerofaciens]|uniref:DNA cytosine methyltransferase n=1 Tax=Collinsella aerofaciens TaxID=74426 RepID=UPI001D010D68|nr:DNA cytosine methyltransferase [Collinsella aerofaciens]MCB5366954.1 DNA cytosine methyltransferase [Collinsella aerofaciens]MCB5369005.1 DNA cytosine methyltransferase [Collinsella aerofaciens]
MIFRKGELFCGPGGLALGAKMAEVIRPSDGEVFRVEHTWASDIDKDACETIRYNICPNRHETVIQQDVRELDIASFAPIDCFAFGFPCNDFSVVGEQKGMDGEYGPLYSYGVKVLEIHQPLWFIAENVGGLESANEGKAFLQILNDLKQEGSGYRITPHLYKFEEYGVPQKRHRIIIVGIRRDLNLEFKVPAPTHINRYRTAREALEEPPIPPDALNHEFTRHQQKVVEMLSHIPPGQNAWYEGIPEHLRLNVKGARLSQIYRRLHPDEPAYTVTGSGGGGTHMYHWREPRALTNRERARIQTFPDNYYFKGSKESVRKQVGMAVPPEGARVIVEAILKTFAGIPYEFVEPKWKDGFG